MEASSLSPATVVELLRRLQTLGFCLHLDTSDDESSIKKKKLALFDKILKIFMEEFDRREKIPLLPAMLGNGLPVDLFKLYQVVCEKGGYESVSSWASVADEIGYGSKFASSVKLFYFKYLGNLNPLLRRVLGESSCEPPVMLGSNGGEFLTLENGDRSNSQGDNGGSMSSDTGILDLALGDWAVSSPKRKRETPAAMLDWLLSVAKRPGDLSSGRVSSDSHGGAAMSNVLMVRRLIFSKGILLANDVGSQSQKRQKIDPSVYDDSNDRDTNRDLTPTCSRPSYSISGSPSVLISTPNKGGKNPRRRLRSSSSLTDATSDLLSRGPMQKRIPIGEAFQAQVPEWTGTTTTSSYLADLKWLGTQTWPLERGRSRAISGRVPVGKGRERNCACQCPDSVECVRFHVAEKRAQLRGELGSSFDEWGFNSMGEEVALTWTEQEERRFKAVVRLNPPSLSKNLWDQLSLSFPSKGRQSLVNYYFNVFLPRRRSYQNRTTPKSVDSDEEERDYGFLSRPFTHDALIAPDPQITSCALNTHYVDLTCSSDTDLA